MEKQNVTLKKDNTFLKEKIASSQVKEDEFNARANKATETILEHSNEISMLRLSLEKKEKEMSDCKQKNEHELQAINDIMTNMQKEQEKFKLDIQFQLETQQSIAKSAGVRLATAEAEIVSKESEIVSLKTQLLSCESLLRDAEQSKLHLSETIEHWKNEITCRTAGADKV